MIEKFSRKNFDKSLAIHQICQKFSTVKTFALYGVVLHTNT